MVIITLILVNIITLGSQPLPGAQLAQQHLSSLPGGGLCKHSLHSHPQGGCQEKLPSKTWQTAWLRATGSALDKCHRTHPGPRSGTGTHPGQLTSPAYPPFPGLEADILPTIYRCSLSIARLPSARSSTHLIYRSVPSVPTLQTRKLRHP